MAEAGIWGPPVAGGKDPPVRSRGEAMELHSLNTKPNYSKEQIMMAREDSQKQILRKLGMTCAAILVRLKSRVTLTLITTDCVDTS